MNQRPPPQGAGATVWVIGSAIGRADIPRLCERLAAVLRDSGAAVVICDVGAIEEPDTVTIEALARLHLTARRLGRGIEVQGADPRLHDLVAFVGLSAVLPLMVEPRRQAEQREQPIGVEEVVDPLDPPG